MLQERFGRKQLLTYAHMESLSKLNTSSMDVQQLQKFYDDCESNIRALETLGVQTDCYGSLLIPILLKKLPQDLRCITFRANPTAYSSVNDLRRAICQELETTENSQLTQDINPSVSTTDDIFVPTAGALLTHSQRKSPPPQKPPNMHNKPDLKPCIYGKHLHNNCYIVKTTKQRKTILNKKKEMFELPLLGPHKMSMPLKRKMP